MPQAGEQCTSSNCYNNLITAGLFCNECISKYNFTHRELKLLSNYPVKDCPEELQSKVNKIQEIDSYESTQLTNFTNLN